MTENIFNLTDVSDVPAEISSELSYDKFAQNILKLFELAGRNLDINEVTVGYYRQFKEVETKKQIMAKLSNMARGKNPKIKSVGQGRGVYGVIK